MVPSFVVLNGSHAHLWTNHCRQRTAQLEYCDWLGLGHVPFPGNGGWGEPQDSQVNWNWERSGFPKNKKKAGKTVDAHVAGRKGRLENRFSHTLMGRGNSTSPLRIRVRIPWINAGETFSRLLGKEQVLHKTRYYFKTSNQYYYYWWWVAMLGEMSSQAQEETKLELNNLRSESSCNLHCTSSVPNWFFSRLLSPGLGNGMSEGTAWNQVILECHLLRKRPSLTTLTKVSPLLYSILPFYFPYRAYPQSEITLFIYCLSPPLERQPHEGKDLSSALFTAVFPAPSKPLINTCWMTR